MKCSPPFYAKQSILFTCSLVNEHGAQSYTAVC